ncbi:MAG: YciI family protein [Ilumatobacteraceae bacterium]
MRYMLLIYTNPTDVLDEAARATQMAGYWEFGQKIAASGELVVGEELQAVDVATTVRVRSGATTTTDGPFAETKEVLGGFYMVDVTDLDRAIEIAAQIPDSTRGSIEVRPIVDHSQG